MINQLICENCLRVWGGAKSSCCGEVVRFDPVTHGERIVALSNAWLQVWNMWKDHPAVQREVERRAENHNYGAAGALNAAIRRLVDDDETRLSQESRDRYFSQMVRHCAAMQRGDDVAEEVAVNELDAIWRKHGNEAEAEWEDACLWIADCVAEWPKRKHK